tara:strand:+ start:1387 stop:1512 length:126 start_codon:yes stop_codon:yes gene_type:complete
MVYIHNYGGFPKIPPKNNGSFTKPTKPKPWEEIDEDDLEKE